MGLLGGLRGLVSGLSFGFGFVLEITMEGVFVLYFVSYLDNCIMNSPISTFLAGFSVSNSEFGILTVAVSEAKIASKVVEKIESY